MFGFLNVYKQRGMTSHDVVAVLRRITKIKQIGHAGTLDPLAEGVLPIAIGKATRLIEYLNDDKAYIGTIQFGAKTSTYDSEGEIIEKSGKRVQLAEIETALENFSGEIEQRPPVYSAVKVNGKKLYEYARKGETAEIKPRKVNIKELKILNFDYEKQTLELYIDCSKGTYIRSIANDLGEILGTYGHLTKLVRERAGKFNVKNSIIVEVYTPLDKIKEELINPLECLDYPVYDLNSDELKAVSHGSCIESNLPNGTVILTSNDNIAGIGEASNGIIKCRKVFI